jgi:hypothetical protein
MTYPIIPRPIQGTCDACSCIWNGSHGEPNSVDEWCTPESGWVCPCHDERFSTALYEPAVAA